MERRGLHAALLLALLGAALLVGARPGAEGAPTRAARKALIDTVGLGSLALTSDTLWGRELAEGTLVPLADRPAGPCLHLPCDAVAPPRLGGTYTLKVLR